MFVSLDFNVDIVNGTDDENGIKSRSLLALFSFLFNSFIL